MKILVADDDRSIGLALQMMLEDLGHECLVAEDGRAALALYEEHGADVIISDWRMPGLEGPELCQRIRAEEGQPYVYFVILTVLNDPQHVREGMESGADDYLTKPFAIDALRARLIAAERVTSLHRDLTERNRESLRAAEERGRLLHQLERERSQLEAVIHQMPAGVVIASAPSGETLLVNDRLKQIWHDPDLGSSSVLQLWARGRHLDGRPYRPEEWPSARSMANGEHVSGEELEIVRTDETTGTLRVSSAPIHQGNHIAAVVVVVDEVTEERRRQREAVQAEKLRALGELAGGVAHDLNQSLTLLAGYADLAQLSLDEAQALDVDEMRDMLRIMAQAAYDGGETVKRLLTFGRNAPDGSAEPIEVMTLLNSVASLTTPRWRAASQAEGRPITLTVEPGPPIFMEGWAASLREALTNLVFNAIDALPTGGSIVLRGYAEGGSVIVEVTDTGVGMAPEVQQRIFEPFFTTKGEHGTGLGLPMVFGIIKRHQGEIDVQSALGEGTTFRLRFPTSLVLAPKPEALQHESANRRVRVLVVDDEQSIRQMVARILSSDGHEVVTLGSAEEALEHLSQQQVDVLISDIGLGTGMNGWQLIDQVHVQRPEIRLILASGWGAEIDPEAAATRGVSGVIAKPYRIVELRRLVTSQST